MANLIRSTYHYQTQSTDNHQNVQEIRQLAERQWRWGSAKTADCLRISGSSLEPQTNSQDLLEIGTEHIFTRPISFILYLKYLRS